MLRREDSRDSIWNTDDPTARSVQRREHHSIPLNFWVSGPSDPEPGIFPEAPNPSELRSPQRGWGGIGESRQASAKQ